MIYAEPENARGRSFHGLLAYMLHDTGQAVTAHRVLFAQPMNLIVPLALCADEMTGTAQRALVARKQGRKPDRMAFHFVLSWHPDDRPTPEHMLATARSALTALGLADFQAVIVGHDDTDKRHIHVAANVIHPETGKAAKLGWRHRTMSRWSVAYEQQQGEIRCKKRLVPKAANENRKRRQRMAWNSQPRQEKQKASSFLPAPCP